MYDATFKIILFGDPGCGKNTLVQRFLTNFFVSDSKYTIGVNFEVKSLIVDGQRVKLQIWAFEGHERFRILLPTYFRGARGSIFMYDITNYSSIAHIDDWLKVIKQEIRAEDMFPIIVVGGKADLAENREVSASEGIMIAKSRGLDAFIECSSKTGENVEETFKVLTRLMLDYSEPREIGVRPTITYRNSLEQDLEFQGLIEKKINLILELERVKEREESFLRRFRFLLQQGTQVKDKTFMDQNLEQWLETLKGLKEGCEEIIPSLRDKNEHYYYHISFDQWKYLLKLSSELLEEFKENPSSFYKMSDDSKRKLYSLFEIFIPCREILSNGSFGKNIRITFEEYLKILKLEK